MRQGLCLISPLLLVSWTCQHRGIVVAATLAETAMSEPTDGIVDSDRSSTSFGMFDSQLQRYRLKRHRRSRNVNVGGTQYADELLPTSTVTSSLEVEIEREVGEGAIEEDHPVHLSYSPLTVEQSSDSVQDNIGAELAEEDQQRLPQLTMPHKGQSSASEPLSPLVSNEEDTVIDIADTDGDANAADSRSLAQKKKVQRQMQSDPPEIDTLDSASSDYNIDDIASHSRDSRDQLTTFSKMNKEKLSGAHKTTETKKGGWHGGGNNAGVKKKAHKETKKGTNKGLTQDGSLGVGKGAHKAAGTKKGSSHGGGSNKGMHKGTKKEAHKETKKGTNKGLPQDGSPGVGKGAHKAAGTKKSGWHGGGTNKGMHKGTKKEAHKEAKKGAYKGSNNKKNKEIYKGMHKGKNKGIYKGMHKGKNKGSKKGIGNTGNVPSGKPGGGMGLPPGYGHGWGTGGGWASPPRPKWYAPPKRMCPCPHKSTPKWHGGWPSHHDGARGGNGGGMDMRPYSAELGGQSGGDHQEDMPPSLSANGKELSSSSDGGGDNEEGELVPMNGGWYPASWGPGWGGSRSSPPMCECEMPHSTKSPTHHPTDNQSGHL